MVYSTIISAGHAVPEKILTNAELATMVDTSDEWIQERTGIRERRIANDNTTTADLAFLAAQDALSKANMPATDIDMVLVATSTPDKHFPSTACLVQSRLKIGPCPAFDIAAACAGFNYALSIADQYIHQKQMKTILVIGAETMSKIVDWQDRSTCVLFGDGAGCVILQASETPGLLATHIHADGEYQDLLYVDNPAVLQAKQAHIKMRGNELFRVAVKTLGDEFVNSLAEAKLNTSEVNWLIPHQANYRIIQAVAKRLNLSMDKVLLNLEYYGNTSAASIPLALSEGIEKGLVKRGQLLLMESFGGGLTWGSALVRF